MSGALAAPSTATSVKRRRGPASRASSEQAAVAPVEVDKITSPRRGRRPRERDVDVALTEGSQQVTHSSHQVEDPKTDAMTETAVSSPPRSIPTPATMRGGGGAGGRGMSPPPRGGGVGGGGGVAGSRGADPSRRRLKGWGANFISLAFKTYYRQGHSGTTGVFSLLLHPAVLFTICAVFSVLAVSTVLSWLHVRTATSRIVVSDVSGRESLSALSHRVEDLVASSQQSTKHMQFELDAISKSTEAQINERFKQFKREVESRVMAVEKGLGSVEEEARQAREEAAKAVDISTRLEGKVEDLSDKIGAEINEVKRMVQDTHKDVQKLINEIYGDDGGPLTKREVLGITKSLIEERAKEGNGRAISLEDVRMAARKIVLDELAKHAADGIGRTDYALGSGGAKVVDHSEPVDPAGKGIAAGLLARVSMRKVDERAHRVVEPNLGQPGHCFPLKGSEGTIDIALRTTIVPDAFTLEHVSKSVAYEISSAPRDFKVYGWDSAAGKRSLDPPVRKLLGEFTYDVEGSPIQTFNIDESESMQEPINMIRLHVLSNHGHPNHTCVYRIRVHGSPASGRQSR